MVEREELTGRRIGVDYCLSDGDGSATLWSAPPNTDVDADGTLDAVGLDVDGDGTVDDMLADLDGDGLADHAVVDGLNYFTDDGSGTWAVSVDRGGPVAAARHRRRRSFRPRVRRRRRLRRPRRRRPLGLKLTDATTTARADAANDL